MAPAPAVAAANRGAGRRRAPPHRASARGTPAAAPLPALAESDACHARGARRRCSGAPPSSNSSSRRTSSAASSRPSTICRARRVAQRLVPLKPVPGPLRAAGAGGQPRRSARTTRHATRLTCARSKRSIRPSWWRSTCTSIRCSSRRMPSSVIPRAISTTGSSRSSTICSRHRSRTGPIALTQPKVLYEFADPALQDLSAGQKMLVRMGPENEARVKAKLREFKRALTRGL